MQGENMKPVYTVDPVRFTMLDTEELRGNLLVSPLFMDDEIQLTYVDVDRAIVGSAAPRSKALELGAAPELRAEAFCERRELGILNIGGSGTIQVDGESYEMASRDCLYVGRGTKRIRFEQSDSAAYYLLSYPAHQVYSTLQVKQSDATPVELGSVEESNARTIYKYIHPAGVKSCQLVMGITLLKPGCVWNTMPAHTHERRMEIYFYFDLDAEACVFHLCGPPEETRHIVVRNREAVISPSWSLHSGVGTKNYTFCWGMGGENQAFDDMDFIDMKTLR
jgi:4-deoxy-L-threo-5-hexosulose-uronate ketol-isomerase